MAFSQGVGGPPSDVVAGFGVFGTGIANGEDDPGVGEFLRRLIVDLVCAGFRIGEKACEAFEGAGLAGHRSFAGASTGASERSGIWPWRICLNWSSFRTGTFKRMALSSLEPASAPATR